MSIFDLHMHSNNSRDADYEPKKLVSMAKEANLKCIALSDHNDMHGIDEMIEYGKKEGILVIPAIEFDTLFDDLEVHLLGYNFDYKKPYYQTLAQDIFDLMDAATHQRIEKFREVFHVELDEDEIMRDTKPGDNPFFTICKKMLNDPANQDIPAFQDYLPGGKRSNPQIPNFYWDICSPGGPCYVKVNFPSFKETIDRIHEDGGIAVLAHPWKNFYHREDLLLNAIDMGLDGIEAYSNYHNDDHNQYYDHFCKEHNLLMTCGSDFHGVLKPQIKMGEYGYSGKKQEELLQNFLKKIHISYLF